MLQTCRFVSWTLNFLKLQLYAGRPKCTTLLVLLLTFISINAGPFRFLELPPSLESDCYSYAHKWKVGTHFQNDPWKLYQIRNIEHFNKWLCLLCNFDNFYTPISLQKYVRNWKLLIAFWATINAQPIRLFRQHCFDNFGICSQKVALTLIQNGQIESKNIGNGHLDCILSFFAYSSV